MHNIFLSSARQE